MSTVKVGTVASQTAATPPVFEDNAAREIGQLCTAWVNFNGIGTVTIRNSFNVASITDNGVGDYTINFATVMANANYAVPFNVEYGYLGHDVPVFNYIYTRDVNGVRILTSDNYLGANAMDVHSLDAAVFGGL